MIPLSFLISLGALALALPAARAEFPVPHNSETTAGMPMPAEEAAAKWKLPAGFKATVFASEPEVQNPIACAWDTRGRLWVAENFTYAERTTKWDAKLRDRVVIFEDRDGDGRHDQRAVFADDLSHLTGIEVGRGGVWLMCPPQLLFIPDRNRDDKADGPPELVLDGFTVPPENHHNFANGIRWGPDGWLYGRCGASAPGLVGAPGAAREARVPLAGGIWRYHPERKVFEALCHGTTNPWGSDWNEEGEMFFTNTVNGHLWQMIPGAHYTRPHTIDPNPHAYELIDQHADHYHYDTGKGWVASRDAGGGADPLGGGHAHCGAMVYLGDNWPAEYRGKLMTLNFHGRRINVERLERRGSGSVARHEPDICFSADPFFRGIDLTYGPDGGVFILDWSDTGECHENTGVHRTSGRIYKISYGEVKKVVVPDFAPLENLELVQFHKHPNHWIRRMARIAWHDRLATFAKTGEIEEFDDVLPVAALLQQPSAVERIGWHPGNTLIRRSWTSILDGMPMDHVDSTRANHPGLSKRDLELLEERVTRLDDAAARLALASRLQRLPHEQRAGIAARLAAVKDDADDHNIPLIIWYGISPLGDSSPMDLVSIARTCEIPLVLRLIARRLCSDQPGKVAALSQLLAEMQSADSARRDSVLAGMHEGFTGWRKAPKPENWDAFQSKFNESTATNVLAKVRGLNVLFGDGRALDEVRKLAFDEKADLGSRKSAVRSLIDARPPDLRAICEKLIAVRFLNTEAVKGLALSDDPTVGVKLTKAYKSFHPSDRAALIDTLVLRPAFARALLDEVKAGRIDREDVSAYHARQIANLGDPTVADLLREVWGEVRDGSDEKREHIAALKRELTPAILAKADKSVGRALFNQACASCHKLYGEGGQLGPDLTGAGRNNLDYLLENILDPSAVVTPEFRVQFVTMKDGRLLSGTVSGTTERTLTLKTMTEPISLERADIAKQEQVAQSLMPEGLLATFKPEQIRDLIAYLMHPTQVPLPSAK